MNHPKIEKMKAKARKLRLPLIGTAAFGVLIGAYVTERKYNPKDKVAIQLPKGLLTEMKSRDQALIIHSNEGLFRLKYLK